MMKKIPTGISGLDEMLNDGLIENRPYLIAGGPGTGKTILCMQFLMEGVRNNEKGLFIALEEQASELEENMSSFGWDLKRIKIVDTTQELSTGMWMFRTDSVVSRPEFTLANLIGIIRDRLSTYQPKRIVIDSLTSVKMLNESSIESRRDLLSLINFLYRANCTTLLTTEIEDAETIMDEFLVSGVIKLHLIEREGDRVSAISIDKIRGSSFDRHIRPMKITNKGISVFPNESVFGK